MWPRAGVEPHQAYRGLPPGAGVRRTIDLLLCAVAHDDMGARTEARLILEPVDDGIVLTFGYRYVPSGGQTGPVTGPAIDRMLRADVTSILVAVKVAALDAHRQKPAELIAA